MVSQVAGSLALLLIAGFMILGFQRTNEIRMAFDPSSMYLLSFDPVRDGYSADRAARLFDTLADRLKAVSGVREVALAHSAPFSPQAAVFTMSAPVAGGAPDQIVSGVATNTIGPHYFAALNVPVIDGREFDSRDQHLEWSKGRALPVVINQTAVHAFFGDAEPVGRRIQDTSKTYEVVGVVKDLSAPLSGVTPGQVVGAVSTVYLPMTESDFEHPPLNGILVMVRSDRGPAAMEGVRKQLAAIDPNIVMFNVHTLSSDIADRLAFVRLGEFVYGAIGVFGLVLAAIGLAGVTAYSVARRRKEIGIRMALGARHGQVLGLVLREGGWLVMVGSVLGLLSAVALSRVFAAFSSLYGPAFGAGLHEPLLLIGAPLLLAGLAMAACYIPARRSARIDPLQALREE